MKVSKKQFRTALVEAASLPSEELVTKARSGKSRSYYVKIDEHGEELPLKAVLRLAYIQAGRKWDKPNSSSVARALQNDFIIVHRLKISDATIKAETKDEAVARMVATMLATVAGANGQMVERRLKSKITKLSSLEWNALLLAKMSQQDHRCALTGLPLGYGRDCVDPEMFASLDRIDSAGHYTPDNVQIVCRFINRWKGADDDALFRRLLGVLGGSKGG